MICFLLAVPNIASSNIPLLSALYMYINLMYVYMPTNPRHIDNVKGKTEQLRMMSVRDVSQILHMDLLITNIPDGKEDVQEQILSSNFV